MIIQCRQCRTKFHFDDTLMQNDGLWMRCSRCGHVFFQDNILANKKENEETPVGETVFSTDNASEETSAKVPESISSLSGHDDDVKLFLDKVLEPTKDSSDEKDVFTENSRRQSLEPEKIDIPKRDEAQRLSKMKLKKQRSQKSKGRNWKIFLWAVLVILVIPAVIYFVVYPQIGNRFIEIAHKYVSEPEPARPEVVIGQVSLQDIRQRMINNNILGTIRVMEGTAVNQADYSICRIAIKGEISDAYSVTLGERISYAGNILTDDELVNMSEDEMSKKLSRPEGDNNSNNKIPPAGQIPFMIVFIHEPPDVIKTTVTVIGAERLL